ncbi:hypothetical protein QYF36_023571 [Acer negundo]|nr:hypothetical protein QYF36_023571 [Acer negundo]
MVKDYCRSTPLHIATILEHVEFIQLIVTKKSGLAGVLDSKGSTALHVAASKGSITIVQILLFAYPEACLLKNRNGMMPLHMAITLGHRNVLELLFHARPQVAKMIGQAIVEYLLPNIAEEINDINAYGSTALDLAIESIKKNEKDWNMLWIVEIFNVLEQHHVAPI